jgi:hypothetical protein
LFKATTTTIIILIIIIIIITIINNKAQYTIYIETQYVTRITTSNIYVAYLKTNVTRFIPFSDKFRACAVPLVINNFTLKTLTELNNG